jgi:hypothetical protein
VAQARRAAVIDTADLKRLLENLAALARLVVNNHCTEPALHISHQDWEKIETYARVNSIFTGEGCHLICSGNVPIKPSAFVPPGQCWPICKRCMFVVDIETLDIVLQVEGAMRDE